VTIERRYVATRRHLPSAKHDKTLVWRLLAFAGELARMAHAVEHGAPGSIVPVGIMGWYAGGGR
jgi:hypothetical protein